MNPYTNPSGVTDRRNLVLETMKQNFPARAAEFEADKAQPLGVLPQPRSLPQGCISSGDSGFFCDYALQFLAENGISRDAVLRGGYTIRTTLDPQVQQATKSAVQSVAAPDLTGIADVMNVIKPGKNSHELLAMTSSRNYGLDANRDQTVQPQPYSMVGDGAGSVFKIFTVAAAMEKGLGTSASLDVPSTTRPRAWVRRAARTGVP